MGAGIARSPPSAVWRLCWSIATMKRRKKAKPRSRRSSGKAGRKGASWRRKKRDVAVALIATSAAMKHWPSVISSSKQRQKTKS